MRVPKYQLYILAAMMVVLAFGIATACGAAAPAPTATPVPAKPAEPTPTKAPAISPEEAERRKTVIFDIDGGRVTDPELWNPYIPGNRKDQGFHQAVMEPLFILNYQTGEIEPWLGVSMTSNATFDEWTLKLRDKVTWSDGNAPELSWSAGIADWVAGVEKVDDLTVKFKLTRPNPLRPGAHQLHSCPRPQ